MLAVVGLQLSAQFGAIEASTPCSTLRISPPPNGGGAAMAVITRDMFEQMLIALDKDGDGRVDKKEYAPSPPTPFCSSRGGRADGRHPQHPRE
eukprot:263809-Prymnesium_polylepis.1